MSRIQGSCLCGGVRFAILGELDDMVACHCTQCRKTSGHFVVATRVAEACLTIESGDSLNWYRSSHSARRGFCGTCGSSLFWKNDQKPTVSIMAGSLDEPSGKRITTHLFAENAGDYYDLQSSPKTAVAE